MADRRSFPMYAIAGQRGAILLLCFIKSKWAYVRVSIYGSRWVLASLAVLGRLHWVDKEKLANFILACQVNNVKNGTIEKYILVIKATKNCDKAHTIIH